MTSNEFPNNYKEKGFESYFKSKVASMSYSPKSWIVPALRKMGLTALLFKIEIRWAVIESLVVLLVSF